MRPQITNFAQGAGLNTFAIAKLVFYLVVGLASFGGTVVPSRLFPNRPERSRAYRGWILALVLALSCAWLNGGWLLVPRESQQWIGYAILLAAFLQGFASPRARLFSSAICAVFAIVVTLLPIAQSALGPLGTPVWFLGSLISYLLVRTVLQPEFTAASLRVPVLLCLPLICSAPMLFFGGSAMLAELAVVGAIAAAANYLASHSSPLGAPFAEAALLFYFLLLLNGTLYADLHPAFAWLQWVVPAVGALLPKLVLRLSGQLTPRNNELATITSVTVAQVVVGLIFYFVARPTLPF